MKEHIAARRLIRMGAIAASVALVGSVFYFSWIPDPAMGDVHWLPAGIANWADRHTQLRTAVPFVFLGLILGLPRGIRPRLQNSLRALVMIWLILSAIVLLAELGQLMIPKRVFDWLDVCLGSGGAAAGLAISATVRCLLSLVIHRKSRHEASSPYGTIP